MRRKKFVLGASIYIMELNDVAILRPARDTTMLSRLAPILRIINRRLRYIVGRT
jgi:hypothetical protein